MCFLIQEPLETLTLTLALVPRDKVQPELTNTLKSKDSWRSIILNTQAVAFAVAHDVADVVVFVVVVVNVHI